MKNHPEVTMPFEFKQIEEVAGVLLIEPKRFSDARGWFMETYKKTDFQDAGVPHSFVQDNHSLSRRKGVLRGLHFQRQPGAQGKLVRVLRGRIFDVVVDLRRGSPTYKEWASVELSGQGARQLWIPPGCAHGFCTLTEECEVAYKVTAEWDPELEGAVAWDDPELDIRWPVEDPILSDADRHAPRLADCEADFRYGTEEIG